MEKSLSLEYNSTRDKLIFSEYGRSVQKLVKYAMTVENKDERQRIVETLVELINQLNPQTKNVLEYKQKLWRHVFKMSNYQLDVESPFGELIKPEDDNINPDQVPYPQHEFNWRHYGYNIRVMIDKALKMEDGPVKKGYVETILSYMKLSYRTWNKEHFVSDDIIISDLAVLSGNQLSVDDDHTIHVVTKNNLPNNNINTFKVSKNKKGGGNNKNQQNKNKGNKMKRK
ncbi:MAG: DUF4290 domain-containing protein [Saprospiraceae bacterium]|nr:MAG: hypothetical protein UZ09_BCD002000391 [Bacteroidetes bacterium OLB9]MCO6462896.1 DUF4290 domain-containing protein [Saprospiraceae bacterium]MCZ2338775.1 DUF4290 domain-containing protein [Chitinophagales bacterium]